MSFACWRFDLTLTYCHQPIGLPLDYRGFTRLHGHMSASALTGHTSVMEANKSDFRIFGFAENADFGIFRWDLGYGKVGNRLEMAVDFKWTDSQLISNHMGSFSTIFKISIILMWIRVV